MKEERSWRRKHRHITPEECRCDDHHCNVCEGGLAICKACGLGEGALTTHCPGVPADGDKVDGVYAGKLDFRYGRWMAGKKAPTQRMWQRWDHQAKGAKRRAAAS